MRDERTLAVRRTAQIRDGRQSTGPAAPWERRDVELGADPDDNANPSGLRSWLGVVLSALVFWTAALVVASVYVRLQFERPPYRPEMLKGDAAVVMAGAAICIMIRAILERVTDRPFWLQGFVAATLVVLSATPFEYMVHGLLAVTMDDPPRSPPFALRVLLPSAILWAAPFAVWAVGNLALLHDAEARRRERRLAQAQLAAYEAQMRALRYQINPHFLHNTLNSIATLILDRRNDDAERMVLGLSDFFRTSLLQDPLRDNTLADEIELQRLYLDIERVRFSDQLEVEFDLPDELVSALTPALILQPLVENVLKHGLRGPGRLVRLRIAARRAGDDLILDVIDDGRGAAAHGGRGGLGLQNVERRLLTRFPRRGRVETVADEDGFRVRLTLPLQFA